jgi:inositol-phosphate transport system permease protein
VLAALTLPVTVGYLWIVLATFAERTHGLVPVDDEGNFGGFTLRNWSFLWTDPNIWIVTFNTFLLAAGMTVIVVAISALAGYALSRLGFAGRRTFLVGTLVLHAFPSVTLLIPIFFVLRWLSNIPFIGDDLPVVGGLGYNTIGGVILVSVALQLPLGVWLMKGFFDGVSWDMERSALIDGCSRYGAWWRVVLPQVRPGIAALSIFSFIIGWGSFIIPYTYIANTRSNVIAVYLNQLLGDTSPVNYGEVAAVGLFQLVPVIVFFLFTQKYLLNIFAGGSKGGT